MKYYIVQWRARGAKWANAGTVRAKSPAGAIAQVIRFYSDVKGDIEFSAGAA